jgi:hypothetical protein
MVKVIDLGAERDARRRDAHETLDKVLEKLRAMPVNERADVLVSMFSMVCSEFATMVLDHSNPTPRTRRWTKKMGAKSKGIIRHTRRPKT